MKKLLISVLSCLLIPFIMFQVNLIFLHHQKKIYYKQEMKKSLKIPYKIIYFWISIIKSSITSFRSYPSRLLCTCQIIVGHLHPPIIPKKYSYFLTAGIKRRRIYKLTILERLLEKRKHFIKSENQDVSPSFNIFICKQGCV